MAFLVGMSGGVKGQRFELKKDRTTLGRGPNNDVVLDDGAISGQHCYIACRGNRYVLHDLNSTNGTLVNAQRATEAELQPRQVIQIGSQELMFDDEAAPAAATSSSINPQVEVDATPVTASTPKSFSSVSPFGTRRQERNKALWLTLIGLVGVLALGGLVYLFYLLFK